MHTEHLLRILSTPILINSCSTNVSGLYSGKAGYSLALYLANNYLYDEYIEQRAYDLLRETLLISTDDISFENGLSGIGYVLLYLIDNDYLDANFEELFCTQHNKIMQGLNQVLKKKNGDMPLIKTCHYLQAISSKSKYWKESRIMLENIISQNINNILSVLNSFSKQENSNSWTYVLGLLENCLEVQVLCNYKNSQTLDILETFSKIYKGGKVTCSHNIGYYMKELDITNDFQSIIEEILVTSSYIKYYPELRDFKSHIEADKIWGNDAFINFICSSTKEECESLFNIRQEKESRIIGYENGISRLVIYLANKKIQLL